VEASNIFQYEEGNLPKRITIYGEPGLEYLTSVIRANWKANRALMLNAKEVVFEPDGETDNW